MAYGLGFRLRLFEHVFQTCKIKFFGAAFAGMNEESIEFNLRYVNLCTPYNDISEVPDRIMNID